MKHAVPLNEAAVARLHTARWPSTFTPGSPTPSTAKTRTSPPSSRGLQKPKGWCNIWKENRFRIAQAKLLRFYEHDLANIRMMGVTRTHEKRSPMQGGVIE